MTGRNFRWLGLALLAGGSAGLLSLTSMMNAAFAYGDTPVDPTVPFEVMGGSGDPIPDQAFLEYVQSLYFPSTEVFSGQPTYPDADPLALVTPEQFFPSTGVNSLPLDTSVSEGVTILNDAIAPQLDAGDPVGVFGISQSAVIASLEMEQLDPSGMPSDLPATFVLVDDLMDPNGGIFERFDGLSLPSLGLDFYGATPGDDFATTIYSLEYDGYADFPRYPLDFLSDLNALAGMAYVHGMALDLTPAQLTTAIELPTSGATETTYYMIPTTDLPLLDPVRDIPVIGNPIADLLQPDLTYLVNLGYGDPLYGWSTSAANVPTEFGLFPSLSDIEMMPGLLVSGAEQGVENFIGDFTGSGPNPVSLNLSTSLESLTSLLSGSSGSGLTDPLADLSALVSDPGSLISDFANTLSTVASTDYGALLPTADIANALVTSVPAYDISLFLDGLEAGNLLDALGYPIAADVALVPLIAGFDSGVIGDAVSTTLSALIP
ncbi:PE-PPE domain-containing protein [Mycobacterium sp.]|uniref:PE-PPE domain-containing protein n=2 Tax=Mycobacterium sp. TaxID=1785 RepID=UPI003C75CFD0